MQLCDKRTTSPATGEGGKCVSKPGLAQTRNDEIKERIHKSYILQVCQQMSQKPRQFRRVSVWPALDEPTLWLERKALLWRCTTFLPEVEQGSCNSLFRRSFSACPSFATNHVARLQRRTQNQQPFKTPAALQTAEQRRPSQEKTSKFPRPLVVSILSLRRSLLCSFGIAKSPGRCRHDEIFNHGSQHLHRPSNHRGDPTPIINSPRSRKPLGIRTTPVLILP